MLLRIAPLLNDFASFFKNLTRSLYLCIGKEIQLKLAEDIITLPDLGGRIESHNWKNINSQMLEIISFLSYSTKEKHTWHFLITDMLILDTLKFRTPSLQFLGLN